jgi:hypothetical protein
MARVRNLGLELSVSRGIAGYITVKIVDGSAMRSLEIQRISSG